MQLNTEQVFQKTMLRQLFLGEDDFARGPGAAAGRRLRELFSSSEELSLPTFACRCLSLRAEAVELAAPLRDDKASLAELRNAMLDLASPLHLYANLGPEASTFDDGGISITVATHRAPAPPLIDPRAQGRPLGLRNPGSVCYMNCKSALVNFSGQVDNLYNFLSV